MENPEAQGGGKKGAHTKKKGGTKKTSQITESDSEHEKRVDNLLAELLPGRYGKSSMQKLSKVKIRTFGEVKVSLGMTAGRKRTIQCKKSPSGLEGEYGLTQPDYNGVSQLAALALARWREAGKGRQLGMGATQQGNIGRDEPSLSAQLVHLRKELQGRDDRLQRLTEQSMNLSQLCEKQKMEISELKRQLNTYEMELEAKEQRASDAARLRKKAQKKRSKWRRSWATIRLLVTKSSD